MTNTPAEFSFGISYCVRIDRDNGYFSKLESCKQQSGGEYEE